MHNKESQDFNGPGSEKMRRNRTDTSIIIVTYNQAHLLKRALQALASQTVHDFEVIIIDDGSTDTTGRVCRETSSLLPNFHYHYLGLKSEKGLGSCRNLGIKASSGDFLLFTDSDCVPEPNWVEKMKFALERKVIVAGAVRSPTSDYFLLCHNFAQFHCFLPENKAGPIQYIAGANMGMRKFILEKTGLFEEGCNMAEDMEWLLRARINGFQPIFEPDAMTNHLPEARSNLWPILKYAVTHAESTIQLRIRYSNITKTPILFTSPILFFFVSPAIAIYLTLENFIRNPKLFRYLHTLPVVLLIRLAWCKGAIKGLKKMNQRE